MTKWTVQPYVMGNGKEAFGIQHDGDLVASTTTEANARTIAEMLSEYYAARQCVIDSGLVFTKGATFPQVVASLCNVAKDAREAHAALRQHSQKMTLAEKAADVVANINLLRASLAGRL